MLPHNISCYDRFFRKLRGLFRSVLRHLFKVSLLYSRYICDAEENDWCLETSIGADSVDFDPLYLESFEVGMHVWVVDVEWVFVECLKFHFSFYFTIKNFKDACF